MFIPINRSSNPLLRSFHKFWWYFADKVTTGTYNFVCLIVKIILLGLSLLLSLAIAAKTQWFVHLRFGPTFQLINYISRDLQKLPRYFKGTKLFVNGSPKIT